MTARASNIGRASHVKNVSQPIDRLRFAPAAVVIAACIFNFVLCFLNTNGMHVTLPVVAATELLVMAGGILLTRTYLFQNVLIGTLLVVGWLIFLKLVNPYAIPKILIDVAIPVVFFGVGRTTGGPRSGDRLLLIVALIVLAAGLFEWFAFDLFQRLFNIYSYYVSKGDLTLAHAGDTGTTLAENGMRPDARAILPFLGLHRDGSIFLEPISNGNFAVISVGWVMARRRFDRVGWVTLAIAAIMAVLADDRFAVGAGALVVVALNTPVWRLRWFVSVAPLAVLAFLLIFADLSPFRIVDNTIGGRLYGSGQYLLSQGILGWFALQPIPLDMDSGYSYLVDGLGFLPALALWLTFSLRKPMEGPVLRYSIAIAIYVSLSLCVSGSALSIKTGALMWFLLGCISNSPPIITARSSKGAAAFNRAPLEGVSG